MSLAEMLQGLPEYQCHKIVRGSKIVQMEMQTAGGALVQLEDKEEPVMLMADFFLRFKPVVGAYIVVYEDGYVSVSPTDAFESGYTRL
jgi:hypothetical protein